MNDPGEFRRIVVMVHGKWHKIEFLDAGRSPKCQPNPVYPTGIDIDLSFGADSACVVALPYPAPRCGAMAVHCTRCGNSVAVTVAGRQDDPRTVKLGCTLP